MSKQRGDIAIVLTFVLVIFIVLISGCLSQASCQSRWHGSGLQSTWGPIQGCKVKLADGRWLPEDRVREIDIKAQQP
jgi:hypothetical protein